MDKSACFDQQGKQPMMNEQLPRRTMPLRNRRAWHGTIGCDENHTAVEGASTGGGTTMVERTCWLDEVAT
ncbi:hypothetical protein [Methylobacterium sp. SyP6R]|uniref:hypothetical protein n=1 Tax=Methylobacterium sp. SyP6R TaxID=2718876 RepID=UPI001F32A081|nr:hypothetical protein [Methylobacterium sp. SyP6R]MCF4124663.1 hypothetical protein [Methylobacterium sp. SyP6R]